MTAGPGREIRRALVVGSGSAGGRHLTMLRRMLPGSELVVVRRSTRSPLPQQLAELDVRVEGSVEAAAALGAEVAVVASPATMHAADAVHLLDAGSHVLVEKPLAATSDDGSVIADSATRAGRALLVGYHLRFGEVAPLIARTVRSGVLGPLRSFRFEVGQHLDQWRPGTDPRRSVSARQELGGGVLLELSHELDAVRFVVGDITEVTAHLRTDGAPTDGKVETVADLTVAADGVRGEVHLDMTSRTAFRRWQLTGEDGSLHADLLTGRVERSADGSRIEVRPEAVDGERDLAEERLIRHLLDVAGGATPRCTAADGIAALAAVESARTSAATGRPAAVERPRASSA